MRLKRFRAKAGGGAVEATVTGGKELKSIKISPEAVDPDDVEMLQDLIVAAVNEAMGEADKANAEVLGKMTGGLGGLGGLRLLMDLYSGHVNKLIEELASLPGIGGKSAQRLAFYIINMPKDRVARLSGAINDARENVHYCKKCCTLTDGDLCPICSNDSRDKSTIMVVENSRDLAAYERTGKYNGLYHVLQEPYHP